MCVVFFFGMTTCLLLGQPMNSFLIWDCYLVVFLQLPYNRISYHLVINLSRKKIEVICWVDKEKRINTWTYSGTQIGRDVIRFWAVKRSWWSSRLISSIAFVCCLIISAIFFCNEEIVCWYSFSCFACNARSWFNL